MSHHDHVPNTFLERQCEEGMALAAASDLLDLRPLDSTPSRTYLARFHCTGLVRCKGQVVEHDDFLVGIRFPDAYFREFDTARVLSWCAPAEIWHPNIRAPFVCAGNMQPATPLVDLLFQIHEIITWHNVEMRERNALNHDACMWARNNLQRFPIDRRPLKRRVSTAGYVDVRPEPAPQQAR